MTCWHTLGKSICCYFVIRINYSIRDREMKVCHFTTRHCRQQVVSHRDVCEAPLWCCICASFPSMHTKMLSKQKRKNRFLQAYKCSASVLLQTLAQCVRSAPRTHRKPSLILSQPLCSVHTQPSPVLQVCHLPKQSENSRR